MKKYIKLLYPLIALALLLGCESEQIMYDSSKNHVAFVDGSISIPEEGGTVGIPVMVAAMKDAPSVKVYFGVDEDYAVAINGQDYSIQNTPHELEYTDGYGYDTIWITPRDNNDFGGNITFVLKILGNTMAYDAGSQDSIICTIVDNEHPLGQWIGTYSVHAASYGSPGEWDESWVVTTYADPNDVSILWFSGIAGGDIDVAGKFDLEAGTVTFDPAVDVGDAYGYGATGMYQANDDMLSIASGYVTEDLLAANSEAGVTGTIEQDGSMHIDKVGLVLEDMVYLWDVFDTYWTPGAASFQTEKSSVPKSIRRP